MSWFTLTELLIVIVIIGVLMTIGNNIARNRINTLRYQDELTDRHSTIQHTINETRTSSFLGSQEFETFSLSLSSSGSQRSWIGSWWILETTRYDHNHTALSGELHLDMNAYDISCTGSWTVDIIATSSSSDRCFYLQNTPCRIVAGDTKTDNTCQ